MSTTIDRHARPTRLFDLFALPARTRIPVLDRRYVGDDLKRDLGLLDGHRTIGGVDWS